jgi:heme A synthase
MEEGSGYQEQIKAVSAYKNRILTKRHRYRDLLTAFVMLLVLMGVQALLNIDGVVTALVGMLAGVVATYFGLSAYVEGKEGDNRS